jgi:hypothetical protein
VVLLDSMRSCAACASDRPLSNTVSTTTVIW